MRRKGFLKRIIGALCVGALISMPVTVNAAEKEDVVGEWTGSSWASVIFDEEGMADDFRDDPQNVNRTKKPYKIEWDWTRIKLLMNRLKKARQMQCYTRK